jgi:hypothetical protein
MSRPEQRITWHVVLLVNYTDALLMLRRALLLLSHMGLEPVTSG